MKEIDRDRIDDSDALQIINWNINKIRKKQTPCATYTREELTWALSVPAL